jgi:hypothetical protein
MIALSYRANTDCSDIAKRRLNEGSCRWVKTARAIVADAFGDLLAQFNAELVERVNA